MAVNVTARAQTAEALEQAALALKRQIGVSRRALQAVRQAQVGLLGIEVETITQHEEGVQSAHSSTSEETANNSRA